jgi:hypothetical protein
MIKKTLGYGIPLLLLLWVCHHSYSPGLSGGFLLDDQASLSKLAIINDELSPAHLFDYFAASETGLLKRPVSVFSFLLDATNWPADPYPFKRTNLIIHLLNGALLFTLLYLVFSWHPTPVKRVWLVSSVATALWLLNPFLVSSTLYVVQRMAMLPATFVLAGLLCFLWLRKKLNQRPSLLWHGLLLCCVGLFTLLAMLSKENGVLFIFLVALFNGWIIERWLGFKPLQGVARLLIIQLPVVLLALAIVLQIPGALEKYDYRDFDWYQRTLTQFTALTQYLWHLWVPDYFTEGVYTDGYQRSTGLLTPLNTLPSVLLILGLLVMAWRVRKQYIWVSFSVLFFLAAHILESTIFPLEMYFEHRNYVPALFLFVPVAWLMNQWIERTKLFYLVPLGVLVLFVMQTQMRVHFWTNNTFLNQQTMNKFPESVRVHTLYAMQYDQASLPEDALKVIEQAAEIHDDLELRINAAMLRCRLGSMTVTRMDQLIHDLEHTHFTKDDMIPFDGLVRMLVGDSCDAQWGSGRLSEVLQAFDKNQVMSSRFGQGLREYYQAKYHIHQTGDLELAETHYLNSYQTDHDIDVLLEASRDFLNASAPDLAARVLREASEAYKKQFKYRVDWHKINEQISALEQQIQTLRSEPSEVINHHPGKE